jgi:hypothetical protein
MTTLHERIAGQPAPTLDLWRHIYGERSALIGLFRGRRIEGAKKLEEVQSAYFEWPNEAAQAQAWLESESKAGYETYQCGHLLSARRRVKANAVEMTALYVDGDGAQPPDGIEPTAIVQSSPGREQFFWRLTRPIPARQAEQLNRRLANAMAADMSGWDLTQLLRPPGMPNFKYAGRPLVELVSVRDAAWDPDDLDRLLPPLPEKAKAEAPAATPGPALSMDDQDIIERARNARNGSRFIALFDRGDMSAYTDAEHPEGNHSSADIGLCNMLAFWTREHGQLDRIFRQGALYREKWNEVHYSDGDRYGDHTIQNALDYVQTWYDGGNDLGYDFSGPKPTIEPADPNEDKDATIARLQRELAAANHLIANQAQTINDERLQRLAKEDVLNGVLGVLRNPDLEPIEKVAAILVAIPVKAKDSHDEKPDERAFFLGYNRVLKDANDRPLRDENGIILKEHIPGIADQVGKGPSAVSKALKRLAWNDPESKNDAAAVKPGVWCIRRVRDERLDQDTGELIPTEKTRLVVKMPGTLGEVLGTLATFAPERKPSAAGGLRTPCAHENGVKYTGRCRDCDEVMEEWGEDSFGNVTHHHEALFIKNRRIENTPPLVVNSTEVSKNDGIAANEEPQPVQQSLMNNAAMLLEWAAANGWPGLAIERNERGEVVKRVGPGEQSWRTFVARAVADIPRALAAVEAGGGL